jgi:hypothetical protein
MSELTEARKTRRRQVVKEIINDLEDDAAALDRTPFTNRGVAATFGTLMATVQALAKVVDSMLDDDDGST